MGAVSIPILPFVYFCAVVSVSVLLSPAAVSFVNDEHHHAIKNKRSKNNADKRDNVDSIAALPNLPPFLLFFFHVIQLTDN